ncbi:glyoxalase [Sphingomonas parva]|uniref:Glyoxalase n=1 Tax=Sphingomonas parva TaxID=2555898 RepID=A0A4Y8ZPT8_9SPHN|nr:VOC family protein [Sphingomonas parva]TFI58030.1 glyoxalase [Sphingomonas parva]
MAHAIFSQANVVTADPQRSLHFYRLLGADIPPQGVWDAGDGIFHANGAPGGPARLEIDSVRFAALWNAAWRGRTDLAGRVLLGFAVAERHEVDAIWREVTSAGFAGLQPPCDAFWGSRFAIVEDPDGVAVGIMSPQSDEHRSPPPLG